MEVFIVGGAGKVARSLAHVLAGGGHVVRSLHRKPEQARDLAGLGSMPVQGDLTEMSVEALATLMAGSDAVVFSAGAGGAGAEVTNAIDGRGLELAVAAAQEADIRRFLLVSAFPDAMRGGERNLGFENYARVKKLADAHLVATDLDWVILRPGTLKDEPGTGRVHAAAAIPYGAVPRDDVAATLAAIVERPDVSRPIIELTSGDTPIDEALARIARR